MQMNKMKLVLLTSISAIVLGSCITPTSRRYSIPLHEGVFSSGEIDFPIEPLGNVTKVDLILTAISKETYELTEINVIRDYPGDAYYEIDLSLFVGEESYDFDYDYIGTNNNQQDSYVFKSTYLSYDVRINLVINPNWDNRESLEYFGFSFHIYDGSDDQFTFTTDLIEQLGE